MSANLDNFFEPYIPPAIVQRGEDLTKMHYGINLGAVELTVNMYQFGRMRRGIIYPISPNHRPENNSDSTDEINDIIMQGYEPGIIAGAIERDFQSLGFRVLRNITGLDLTTAQKMNGIFRFEQLNDWPNAKMIEWLNDYAQKKTSEYPEMARYLISQVNVINGYQIQHMAEAKKSINDGLKPGLNEYDKAVCKAIGRNPSDYEVNEVERRKAAAEAQGKIIEDFANAVVTATQRGSETDVAAFRKENDDLRAAVEKQGRILETLQALLKEKSK